jgi:1-acylglycerone phosphate reductase
MLSDQLRLELSPWGVKVIEVVTGGIKTHFWDNLVHKPTLPEGSIYLPARKEIESIMEGELINRETGKDVDVVVYAEAVVRNALKSKPTREHWTGSKSFAVWFASSYLPQFFWVRSALSVPLILLLLIRRRIHYTRGLSTCHRSSRSSRRQQRKCSRGNSGLRGCYVYFQCLLLTRHII